MTGVILVFQKHSHPTNKLDYYLVIPKSGIYNHHQQFQTPSIVFWLVNPTTSHEVPPHANLILEPDVGTQKEAEEEDKDIMVVETLAVEVDLYFENKTVKYGQVFHMGNSAVGIRPLGRSYITPERGYGRPGYYEQPPAYPKSIGPGGGRVARGN